MLSNVVRHSQATAVEVRVGTDGELIEVIVRDNGVGFVPNVGSGRGMRNLVSRARELGRRLHLRLEDRRRHHGTLDREPEGVR